MFTVMYECGPNRLFSKDFNEGNNFISAGDAVSIIGAAQLLNFHETFYSSQKNISSGLAGRFLAFTEGMFSGFTFNEAEVDAAPKLTQCVKAIFNAMKETKHGSMKVKFCGLPFKYDNGQTFDQRFEASAAKVTASKCFPLAQRLAASTALFGLPMEESEAIYRHLAECMIETFSVSNKASIQTTASEKAKTMDKSVMACQVLPWYERAKVGDICRVRDLQRAVHGVVDEVREVIDEWAEENPEKVEPILRSGKLSGLKKIG